MEGVAFSLKDTLSIFAELGVPVRAIRLGGGGARSPLWRQIQADAYAQSVEIVAAEEGAAYGAALLAGVGAGVWSSADAACDAVIQVADRIAPQPADSAKLQYLYGLYRNLYPSLKQIFHGLHAANTKVKTNG
jgi:xylulokinase